VEAYDAEKMAVRGGQASSYSKLMAYAIEWDKQVIAHRNKLHLALTSLVCVFLIIAAASVASHSEEAVVETGLSPAGDSHTFRFPRFRGEGPARGLGPSPR